MNGVSESVVLRDSTNVTRIQIEGDSLGSMSMPTAGACARSTSGATGGGTLSPLANLAKSGAEKQSASETHVISAAAVDIPESQLMLSYLRSLMPPAASEELARKSMLHFEQVAEELDRMGETYEGLKALLTTLTRLDYLIAGAGGAVKGLAAAASGYATDLAPIHFSVAEKIGNPIDKAATVGAMSRARDKLIDTFGKEVFQFRLIPSEEGDRYFLAPSKHKLVEPVAELLDQVASSEIEGLLVESALGGLHTGRSVVACAAKAAFEAFSKNPVTGAIADLVVNNTLRVPVFVIKDIAKYRLASSSGQYGLLYLLGRVDWKQRYEDAKRATLTSIGGTGAKNALMLPLDTMRRLPDGAKRIVGAGNVADTVWSVCVEAGSSAVRAALKDRLEQGALNRNKSDAIAQLVSAISLRAVGNAVEPAVEPAARHIADGFWRNVDGARSKHGKPVDIPIV
ncbi:hypothetical protein [Paraburkholderia humisilvae]|uniref:Uncharacterized protein n=1 Tax=Paraburkholderia humisilvae TaxID=627669 RepID=A0A6J5F454_9BURK|nr:hypothetical protein [Paraburkholderia humisilvae]CAB3772016.1 hypothetical protein LMG29542_06765 [Paraburkholderia humisilvae]